MESSRAIFLNHEEMLIASVACLITGVGLCFFSYRKPMNVVSIVSGALFGSFCANVVVPQFDNGDGLLYFVAGAWVSLIGALVASTTAVLVSWVSVGTCLGSLAGLFLVLLDGGAVIGSQVEVSALFIGLIVVAIALS
ncbi:unnamed protein product, partial [Ascophyllum nodosum]